MDKYTYSLKAEKIQRLVRQEDYLEAARIADTVDWKQEHNVRLLSAVSEAYEKIGEYDKAIDVLLTAYERTSLGKRHIYKLTELALEAGHVEDAEAFYRKYLEEAPDENNRYILRYKIAEAKGECLDKRITILETYKKYEFEEEWACRLAELYNEAGMEKQCVALCDEIILWFGVGSYVDRAMELKEIWQPLTDAQREHRENREYYAARVKAVANEMSEVAKDEEDILDADQTDIPAEEPEEEELPVIAISPEVAGSNIDQPVPAVPPAAREIPEDAAGAAAPSAAKAAAADRTPSFMEGMLPAAKGAVSAAAGTAAAALKGVFAAAEKITEDVVHPDKEVQPAPAAQDDPAEDPFDVSSYNKKPEEEPVAQEAGNAVYAAHLTDAGKAAPEEEREGSAGMQADAEVLYEEAPETVAAAPALETPEPAAEEKAAPPAVKPVREIPVNKDAVRETEDELATTRNLKDILRSTIGTPRKVKENLDPTKEFVIPHELLAQADAAKKVPEEEPVIKVAEYMEEAADLSEEPEPYERSAAEADVWKAASLYAGETVKTEEDRLAEELKIVEAARLAEEARKAEEDRLAEEARKAEADRLAEEARKAEAARLAEEAKKAEAARLAEEAKKAEAARLAEEARKAEAAKPVEEVTGSEAAQLAEEAKKAEAARLAEEARKAEEARLAEEARKAEEARLAEEARKAEEARLAEEARKAEAARLAEEARKAEAARLAEEARKAEAARLAEEARIAEEKRKEEEEELYKEDEVLYEESETPAAPVNRIADDEPLDSPFDLDGPAEKEKIPLAADEGVLPVLSFEETERAVWENQSRKRVEADPLNNKGMERCIFLPVSESEDCVDAAVAALENYYGGRGKELAPIAKILAEKLNKRGLIKSIPQLTGKDLIIDQAADLSDEMIKEMLRVINHLDTGKVFVLTDDAAGIEEIKQDVRKQIIANAEALGRDHSEEAAAADETKEVPVPKNRAARKVRKVEPLNFDRINPDRELSERDFIRYADFYAHKLECVLDDSAFDALEDEVDAILREGGRLTPAEAEEVIEDAAEHASRKMFGKKYDKDGFLILREKNFD